MLRMLLRCSLKRRQVILVSLLPESERGTLGVGDGSSFKDYCDKHKVYAIKSFLHFSLVVRNSYRHDIHCNSQTQQCMRS